MPELPEVQTTVNGLNEFVKGQTILDVWTDLATKNPSRPDYLTTTKSLDFFTFFKKTISGTKILSAERRAKNIFIHLSNGYTILIHMKMTGHLLYGTYTFDTKTNTWIPHPSEKNEALRDPFNRFLHTVFILKNGKHLALSDVRKFAKVSLLTKQELEKVKNEFGPEPLEKGFTFTVFTERLLKKPTKKIKTALLDQSLIAGIGNIYSDEALWLSAIHPTRLVSSLTEKERKKLFDAIQIVLTKGIDFGGDSTSDYRDISGKPGKFQKAHEVYRQAGTTCSRKKCTGIIERTTIENRGCYLCPIHQI